MYKSYPEKCDLSIKENIFYAKKIIVQNIYNSAKLEGCNVSNLNDDIAHRVSKQIVEFARHHAAKIIVFEHLGNLKPKKGTRTHRLNHKLGYWVKSRIFRYSQYKALHKGIITSRVNPKNTSKRCPYCGMLTIERYNPGRKCELGNDLAWCTNCNVQDINADFIGTLGIGLNFRLRYCS